MAVLFFFPRFTRSHFFLMTSLTEDDEQRRTLLFLFSFLFTLGIHRHHHHPSSSSHFFLAKPSFAAQLSCASLSSFYFSSCSRCCCTGLFFLTLVQYCVPQRFPIIRPLPYRSIPRRVRRNVYSWLPFFRPITSSCNHHHLYNISPISFPFNWDFVTQ